MVIVEFRVSNFRSVASEQMVSFVAGTGKNIENMDHCLPTPEKNPVNLLKMLALYGPNASGKSNLLKAIRFMIRFIRDSHRQDENDEIEVEPFKFSEALRNGPSEFELTFFGPYKDRRVRYQYGFVIDHERVLEEWLYAYPKGRSQRWLHRKWDDEKPWEGTALKGPYRLVAEERTNDNTLFLSKAGGQERHPELGPVYRWLKDCIIFLDMGDGIQIFEPQARQTFKEDPAFAELACEALKKADTGIDSARVDLVRMDDAQIRNLIDPLPEEMKLDVVKSLSDTSTWEMMAKHQGEDGVYEISFGDESLGTRRMFVLLWAVYESLKRGGLLVIDELEASTHPLLTRAVMHMFHRLSNGEQSTQMVFSTHQTHLLSGDHLRRDQVVLVCKDKFGRTNLESLWDYKKPPRKGEAIEKGYLAGRYGAIPYIEEVYWNGKAQ